MLGYENTDFLIDFTLPSLSHTQTPSTSPPQENPQNPPKNLSTQETTHDPIFT